jgi:hypothetical protein
MTFCCCTETEKVRNDLGDLAGPGLIFTMNAPPLGEKNTSTVPVDE